MSTEGNCMSNYKLKCEIWVEGTASLSKSSSLLVQLHENYFATQIYFIDSNSYCLWLFLHKQNDFKYDNL